MHPKLIMLKKIADGLWTYGSDNESMHTIIEEPRAENRIGTQICLEVKDVLNNLKKSPKKADQINNVAKVAGANSTEMVPIGSGETSIPKELHKKVNWSTYTKATRCLLRAVFPRSVLATHSLTGKPSPAFKDKKNKFCLDKKKVMDIVEEVRDKLNIKENFIRHIITITCADESKLLRMRQTKNQEIISPSKFIMKASKKVCQK